MHRTSARRSLQRSKTGSCSSRLSLSYRNEGLWVVVACVPCPALPCQCSGLRLITSRCCAAVLLLLCIALCIFSLVGLCVVHHAGCSTEAGVGALDVRLVLVLHMCCWAAAALLLGTPRLADGFVA
jgi:hypothetical protein